MLELFGGAVLGALSTSGWDRFANAHSYHLLRSEPVHLSAIGEGETFHLNLRVTSADA